MGELLWARDDFLNSNEFMMPLNINLSLRQEEGGIGNTSGPMFA